MRIAFSMKHDEPDHCRPHVTKANAAVGFAYKLDYKIGTALTPTGAAWVWSASFLDAVADAVETLHTDPVLLRCNGIRPDHVVRQLQGITKFPV